VKIRLTDLQGKPFVGSTVLTVYDRSVEYISGGSNVPEIKEFFWKWRRNHYPQTEASLNHFDNNLLRNGEIGMGGRRVFGGTVADELSRVKFASGRGGLGHFGGAGGMMPEGAAALGAAPMAPGAGLANAADGAMFRRGLAKESERQSALGDGREGAPAD